MIEQQVINLMSSPVPVNRRLAYNLIEHLGLDLEAHVLAWIDSKFRIIEASVKRGECMIGRNFALRINIFLVSAYADARKLSKALLNQQILLRGDCLALEDFYPTNKKIHFLKSLITPHRIFTNDQNWSVEAPDYIKQLAQ